MVQPRGILGGVSGHHSLNSTLCSIYVSVVEEQGGAGEHQMLLYLLSGNDKGVPFYFYLFSTSAVPLLVQVLTGSWLSGCAISALPENQPTLLLVKNNIDREYTYND